MVKASTTARGYHGKHDRLRRQWAPKVDAGLVDCARCHKPIEPGSEWDLGHTDDRTDWQGPEHPRCNRVVGGRNGARVTNAMRRTAVRQSRDW
jgi:hypothetical protein